MNVDYPPMFSFPMFLKRVHRLPLFLQVLNAHPRRLRGHGLLARVLPLRADVQEQAAAAVAVGGVQGARPPLQEEPQVALPSPPHQLHPRRLELLQAHHQVRQTTQLSSILQPPSKLFLKRAMSRRARRESFMNEWTHGRLVGFSLVPESRSKLTLAILSS